MIVSHPKFIANMNAKCAVNNRVWAWILQYWIMALVVASIVLLLQAVYVLNYLASGTYDLEEVTYYQGKPDSTIESIFQLPAKSWKRPKSFTFRAVESKFWLKIDIPIDISKNETLVRFNDPLMDRIEFYEVVNEKGVSSVKHQFLLGDTVDFDQRAFDLPNMIVPLSASKQKTSIYIAGSSTLMVNMSFGLWSSENFISYNAHHTVFFGLLFGYVLALVCFSLMMFATIRKHEYMWYCFYLIGFCVHIMALSGYGYQYIWPQYESLQSVAGGATASLAFLFLVKFTETVIVPSSKLLKNSFKVVVYTHLIITLLSLLTLNVLFVKLSVLAVLLTSFVMPIICFRIGEKGSKPAKFLSLVWFVMLLAFSVSVMDRMQLLAINIDPVFVLIVGFHIEALLIGMALIYGYRVSYYQTLMLKEAATKDEEKALQAKDQILAIQKDAQLKLEKQVKAQTVQLESALSNLSQASDELQLLRKVDGLTSLPNRLAFDESLSSLGKKAIEMAIPLSLAVLDIDHFKKVNDTFGHVAGDDCLCAFSNLLTETFDVNDFAYCRFGGEEFVIATLLPAENFEARLNQFRLTLQALEVNTDSGKITFTTSVGVASKRLVAAADTRKLYSKADENLYLAKQKGRNLVIA